MHFDYLDAVVIDTPILDPQARLSIRNVEELDLRLKRAQRFLDYLDQAFQLIAQHRVIYDWPHYSEEAKKSVATILQRI